MILLFRPPPKNLIYDTTCKEATLTPVSANIKTVALTYTYYKDDILLDSPPVNVGTYTVKANISSSESYFSAFLTNSSWNFTIAPAEIDSSAIKPYNGIYDGSPHPIISIYTEKIPVNSTIEYSFDNQNWSSLDTTIIPEIKTVKDSEEKKIYIRIINSNYVPYSQAYTATINKSDQTPNYPQITDKSVPWSCKKIEDIALPEHWIWKATDISKELEVGKPISADAVYNSTDKGNYVTETVTYTITRSKCEHKHITGRYYSSPSCTSNGYSGDTYCTDCNQTISYGYTISAYGHDYDEGVITTEPTVDTDGVAVYTCKRCKYQDTRTLGRLGDGEPYMDGNFQKKGWDSVRDLIKASKEKVTISINLNGAQTLPASVLSEIKGKDISLNLDMESGFIWKINGTSVTAETPADMNLSVTNTSSQIPKTLYELVSTNPNDFSFHLGISGALDFSAVLSAKADSSCAGLMANLFWYDAQNSILQCIQTATVSGSVDGSTPYADFTLPKGQDYFIVFSTESMNGRSIHTDGSITDENGTYLRPADASISSYSINKNKLTVKLSKGCAGAQGYDFVISKKSNMLQTGKFNKTVSSTGKPQAAFKYLSKGTWYVAARSWILDAQGNKIYSSWSKIKKVKITVVTPQQPKIKKVTVKGNTVTVTYTKCKNATGYEILIGSKYSTSANEKYPVKEYVKRTGNTATVTFKNIKKGTWYIGMRSWNKSSKDNSRVYSPYSTIKKFKVKK